LRVTSAHDRDILPFMFERFNPTARKAIFLARYETSQFGAEEIEPEHLLLGILGAGEFALLKTEGRLNLDSLRLKIGQRHPGRKSISTSIDIPVSKECQRALSVAAEEASRLKHDHIGLEHLLLGVARLEKSFAAELLRDMGVTIAQLHQEATRVNTSKGAAIIEPQSAEAEEPSGKGVRNLTRAAQNGALGSLIGRERELERAIQILCRRTRNNLVLVGEPGVGKTALIEGLARRIAEANVPPELADKRLLAIDASWLAPSRGGARWEAGASSPVPDRPDTMLCVEGLFDVATAGAGWGVMDAVNCLEPMLSVGGLRCIATGTPRGYRETLEKAPMLARHFEAVYVSPPNEAEAIEILMGVKVHYERFHGIVIGDEAVRMAVAASGRFLAHRQLPDRAIDLIDEAGARFKLRRESEPREVIELRRRIRVNTRKMENAIAMHEFDKARAHSEEERADRERLLRLLEDRKESNPPNDTLGPRHVLEVIADRTAAPLAAVQNVMERAQSGEFELIARELGAQIPVELREWVPFLATWVANVSPEDAERLALTIRAAKAKKP
jgi:ATP-dependent Clp protease ATP-binding subunit ClpC